MPVDHNPIKLLGPFALRRRFSLGFSKWRCARASRKVPSRSSFFFSRRRAFSTGSPFFSLTSDNSDSHPSQTLLTHALACNENSQRYENSAHHTPPPEP